MYKKIDLFYLGDYISSTNQSKTCKEAVSRYLGQLKRLEKKGIYLTVKEKMILDTPKDLKAFFDKERNSL